MSTSNPGLTSYKNTPTPALEGAAADNGPKERASFINEHPRAAKVVQVDVDTATAKEYTFELDGVTISATLTGSPTKTNVRDALIDAVNDEGLVNGRIRAAAVDADTLSLTSLYGGLNFDVEQLDSDLSQSTTQSNAEAAPVPFGRGVIKDGVSKRGKKARLPDSGTLTARALRVAVGSAQNSTLYRVVMLINGEEKVADFTSDGSATADEVVNGIASAVDGLSNLLTVTADTGNDNVDIVATTPGFADFHIVEVTPDVDLTPSTQTEGDDIRELFAGLAERFANRQADPDTDPNLSGYDPGDNMTVAKSGRFSVTPEDSVDLDANPEGTVWIRMATNGNLDEIGRFRGSFNAGCVPLPAADFVDTKGSKMMVLEL